MCGKPVETKAYPEMMFKYGRIEVAGYGRPGTDAAEAMNNMEAAEAIAKVLTLSKLVGTQKDLPEEECRYLLSQHEEQQVTFR